MDSTRSQQAWALCQLEGTQDGYIWRFYQCAARARTYWSSAMGFQESNELEGEDLANSDQQFDRTLLQLPGEQTE